MADQPPQQPPHAHAADADEEEQKETVVDPMTDVDQLGPSVVGDAPPHFHAQRPTKRSRKEDSLAIESPPPSPPELYRDALHTVYGWLTFKELARTSRIRKSWYAAACHLKSRGERLDVTNDVIFHLVRSPLCHHINQLTSDTGERLTVASLLLLKTLMPHVDSLRCTIIVTEDTTSQLALPVGLRELTIRLEIEVDSPNRRALVTTMMASVAIESPRLHRVELGIESDSASGDWSTMDGRIFEPLTRIDTLTDLTLNGELHPTCIDVLRRMTQLRRITIDGNDPHWSDADLDQLTAEPHQLALESIERVWRIDPTTAAALVRLPSLTELTPSRWEVDDPGTLLAHLPRLTELKFYCEETVDITLAIAALTRLTNLTSLTINHDELTSTDLCTFLPHLTRLSNLDLMYCPVLSSLECLSLTLHLASTLRTLSLHHCLSIPPSELHHLRALTALRKLVVCGSFTAELNASTIAEFTPGSPTFHSHHFPHLIYFGYDPPDDDDDDDYD
jgi:hypothetical protein